MTRSFEEYRAWIEELDVSTEPNTAVFYSRKDPVFGDEVFKEDLTKEEEDLIEEVGKGVTDEEVAVSAHGGRDDGPIKSRQIAESYARQSGKTTLEMTKGGHELEEQDLYHRFDKAQANELWGRLSERYAEGATGEVVAFSRAGANDQDAFWLQRELPALKRNRAVTKIENYGWTRETLVNLDHHAQLPDVESQLKIQQQALEDMQRAHQASDDAAYDAAKARYEQARQNEEKLK